MTREKITEKHAIACREGMKKDFMEDIIKEFESVMDNDIISDEKKRYVFHMIMDIMKFAQKY